jgi:hypothetical protein
MFPGRVRLRAGVLLLTAPLAAYVLRAQEARNNQGQPSLRATVAVISQGYCINPEEMRTAKNDRVGSVVFLLYLRVENMSERSIILCRDCIQVDSEPALLSLSPDGLPGGVRNGDMIYDGVAPRKRRLDPASPDQHYAILKPHGTFSGNYKAGILVSYDSPLTPRMNLKSGSYFLRVEFGTWWPEATDTTGVLRVKWKRYGDL